MFKKKKKEWGVLLINSTGEIKSFQKRILQILKTRPELKKNKKRFRRKAEKIRKTTRIKVILGTTKAKDQRRVNHVLSFFNILLKLIQNNRNLNLKQKQIFHRLIYILNNSSA